MLWVAFAAAVAAVASAVFAFVQAKAAIDARSDAVAAEMKAEAAQAEASRIAGEARDALGRSASALEAANLIAEKAMREVISWELQDLGDSRYRLVNTGRITAFGAVVEAVAGWVDGDEAGPRDVGPGDSLIFYAISTFDGPTPRAKIRCEDRSGAEPQMIENFLTLG